MDEAYAQAHALLDHSLPVSASISRELLLGALRDRFGAKADSLHEAIAEAASSGRVPPDLAEMLSRLVEIGSLASSPVHDRDPSMIVDVGRDEAELTLKALRGLLSVRPAGQGT